MLPGRPSDAGPAQGRPCPACGATNWDTLTDCLDCHGPVCDRCSGSRWVEHRNGADELCCGSCAARWVWGERALDLEVLADDTPFVFDGDQADASGCEAHVECAVHQIDARPVVADIPEWNRD